MTISNCDRSLFQHLLCSFHWRAIKHYIWPPTVKLMKIPIRRTSSHQRHCGSALPLLMQNLPATAKPEWGDQVCTHRFCQLQHLGFWRLFSLRSRIYFWGLSGHIFRLQHQSWHQSCKPMESGATYEAGCTPDSAVLENKWDTFNFSKLVVIVSA